VIAVERTIPPFHLANESSAFVKSFIIFRPNSIDLFSPFLVLELKVVTLLLIESAVFS